MCKWQLLKLFYWPFQGDSGNARDLVISVDPDKVPLSLLVLSEELSSQLRVFKSTFVHSSVSGGVSGQLRNLLASSNGIKRGDCDLAVTLIWKKGKVCPLES